MLEITYYLHKAMPNASIAFYTFTILSVSRHMLRGCCEETSGVRLPRHYSVPSVGYCTLTSPSHLRHSKEASREVLRKSLYLLKKILILFLSPFFDCSHYF